jgi:hypothetical protein
LLQEKSKPRACVFTITYLSNMFKDIACRDGGAWSNAIDSRSIGLGLREFNRNEQISLPAYCIKSEIYG